MSWKVIGNHQKVSMKCLSFLCLKVRKLEPWKLCKSSSWGKAVSLKLSAGKCEYKKYLCVQRGFEKQSSSCHFVLYNMIINLNMTLELWSWKRLDLRIRPAMYTAVLALPWHKERGQKRISKNIPHVFIDPYNMRLETASKGQPPFSITLLNGYLTYP